MRANRAFVVYTRNENGARVYIDPKGLETENLSLAQLFSESKATEMCRNSIKYGYTSIIGALRYCFRNNVSV